MTNLYSELRDETLSTIASATRAEFVSALVLNSSLISQVSPVAAMFRGRVTQPDPTVGPIAVEYECNGAHSNPWQHLHGGFITACIDESASLAAALSVGFKALRGTQSLHTVFSQPLHVGRFTTESTVLQRTLSFLTIQTTVLDERGAICAHGTIVVSVAYK
jgi:acyl-coenzyme A thioesterase PaaI-like protein